MPDERGSAFSPEVRRALPALAAQRFIVNVGARMVFTFLPAISRGSGMSLSALGQVIFARDITGLLGPASGGFVRRFGSWRTMVLAGLGAAIGMLLVPFGPIGIAIGFVIWGICRTGFLVSMNSWIGDVVAYQRRGRATGLIELTWAGAALVGLPFMGVLIDQVGWWAAPTALGLMGLPLTLLMQRTQAGDTTRVSAPIAAPASIGRNTMMALIGLALMTGATQFLLFTHGLWLEETYGFDSAQVGFAIVAVGIAEAIASYGTSRITDGMGKRNAVVAGTLVLAVALVGFAVFPAPPLAVGLALLVVAFLGFEFAIVSSIAMVSELEPGARSAVVGRSVGLSTMTRASVSLLCGWLYETSGFRITMILGAAVAAVSIVVMTALVHEPADWA